MYLFFLSRLDRALYQAFYNGALLAPLQIRSVVLRGRFVLSSYVITSRISLGIDYSQTQFYG